MAPFYLFLYPFLCLLLAFLLPTKTHGCGGLFCEPARPVVQSGEAILFGVEGNTVTMHVQILYEGPAELFSWVLPVPYQPQVGVGSDVMFSALFRQTLPTFQLDIQDELSTTCSEDALVGDQCVFADAIPESLGEGGAVILEQGSVGPYDFTVLEAAEGDPTTVFRWLEDNGYDQYEGSDALLNFYAKTDHIFVAIKLRKDAETGEIQPLILTYEMPEPEISEVDTTTQVSRMAIACVPVQLTSVAATNNMPIQVYILGDARAVPLNFMEIELDDTQVNWLGCRNNPGCYDDDYRARFNTAASQLVNQSFVTEYAGPASVMEGTITIDVTRDQIANAATPDTFLNIYRGLLPDLPLVDTIVEDFIPPEYWDDPSYVFDAAGLADELDLKVLQPAIDAQNFVNGFSYLTRLYARLGPESMTKDPFFAFKPELPDVSNVHRAIGTPICTNNDSPSALSIAVEGSGENSLESIVVPATLGCAGWQLSEAVPPISGVSPAKQLAAWGFAGDDGIVVVRSIDVGNFNQTAVAEAIAFGDSLVMDQTIPEFDRSSPAQTDASNNDDVNQTNHPEDDDDGQEEEEMDSTGSQTGDEDETSSSSASCRTTLGALSTLLLWFLIACLF